MQCKQKSGNTSNTSKQPKQIHKQITQASNTRSSKQPKQATQGSLGNNTSKQHKQRTQASNTTHQATQVTKTTTPSTQLLKGKPPEESGTKNNSQVPPDKSFTCSDSLLSKTKSHPTGEITVLRNIYPGVVEWILPNNISQSQILGSFHGSNACTIISVLGAIKLASGMIFLVNQEQLSEAIRNFIQSMRTGNSLNQEFGIDPCQPNLEVKEVVEKMRMLQHRIRIIEDTGFFTAAELFQKLETLAK